MIYLPFCGERLVPTQTCRRDDNKTNKGTDEKKYNGSCDPWSKVQRRTLEHIGIRVQRQCLYLTSTTGQHIEQIKSAQRIQHAEQKRDQQRVSDQWQSNCPELLPATAPIHVSSFV